MQNEVYTLPDSTGVTPLLSLQGVKPVPLLVCIAVGLALRFLVPPPVGVTAQAWTLLAIFLSTIAGVQAGSAVC